MKYNLSARNRRGFTLIELLVTVLILAILMAVALPLYLSAVADSQRKTCRANLQTIANAVQAKRVKNVEADYGNEIGAAISSLPDLPATPKCPQAGVYSVDQGTSATNSTYKVTCTLHGSFEPGVDSQ